MRIQKKFYITALLLLAQPAMAKDHCVYDEHGFGKCDSWIPTIAGTAAVPVGGAVAWKTMQPLTQLNEELRIATLASQPHVAANLRSANAYVAQLEEELDNKHKSLQRLEEFYQKELAKPDGQDMKSELDAYLKRSPTSINDLEAKIAKTKEEIFMIKANINEQKTIAKSILKELPAFRKVLLEKSENQGLNLASTEEIKRLLRQKKLRLLGPGAGVAIAAGGAAVVLMNEISVKPELKVRAIDEPYLPESGPASDSAR